MIKIGDLVRVTRYSFTGISYSDIGIVVSELKKLRGELDYKTEKQLNLDSLTMPWVNVFLLKSGKVVEGYPDGNIEVISSS
jgi:hypothetical protein